MNKKTLSKLTTTGTKTFFLLTTIPIDKEDGFEVVLTDGQSVWNGTFSADNMDKQRKKLKMDFATYFNQTEKAFTRADENVNIEYSVKIRPDDTAELVWKKHVTLEDIKFQLGSITLMSKDDPGSSICDILNHSVNVNEIDVDRIKTLQTDNDRLSQERMMALKRLEKCVAAKEEMEKELFSKFVAVLNSKKEKIRHLKENGTVEPESQTEASPSTSSNNVTQRNRELITGKEDLSDKEENTDKEETPPPKRQRRTQRRKVAAGDADSSLDLGDEESPTVLTAVVKRPVRQRGGNKKNTPSRPVLPKVTRNQSNESNDGRGRMSKSSSNNSNISNIDPEDLFGDI